MKELTPPQLQQLQVARDRAIRLKHSADTARTLGLPVLETFLREASVACQAGADFQEAAFRTDDKQKQKARGLGFLPHGEARKEPWADATRSPMLEGGERQADVIAEAIQRKGLLK